MKVGDGCSFYHEGGHGERRWVIGWRYGVIVQIPKKGKRKGFVEVEIPVQRWREVKDAAARRSAFKPWKEKVWLHDYDVNEPGDTVYHGRKLREVVAERKEVKAVQQA